MGMQIFTGTINRPYSTSDLKYDIDRGFLEYANLGYEVKLESRVKHDPIEYAHAKHEMDTVFEAATLIASGNEPLSRKEMLALPEPEREEWLQSEQDELAALRKLGCWERVPRSSATTKVLNCGYVYKQKPPAPPLPARKKARLCVKGWNEDVHNLETFAPVVRFETMKAVLDHAAHEGLELWSCDIVSAYILSPLQDGQEVFMNDPEDPKGDTVLRLRRALYGLRSSARNWNNHLHQWLLSRGFKRSEEAQRAKAKSPDGPPILFFWGAALPAHKVQLERDCTHPATPI